MGERAVALLSGGLDSAVAAQLWLESGGELALCLCADYGQPAAAPEAAASQRLADRFRTPWRALPLPWLSDAARASGSALQGDGSRVPQRTEADPGDEASAAAVWIPARNVVLLAAAAAFAESLGVGVVLAGFNREEAATFADNSAAFMQSMTDALARGTRNGVRVESPTVGLDKAEMVAVAHRAGFGPADFHSCYQASTVADCGCESCVRSRRAWSTLDRNAADR